ncbi:MAG: hypothetical protein EU550_01450, partial [Promethearchaeota archaeon]
MIPIIILLTDFGLKGQHYIAQMKGVILNINPDVKIIDLSHNITPYSIIEAAYVLKTTYKQFPENSIFVAVVDPGVGSSREILLLKSISNYFFIGPNNGLFSNILSEGVKEIIELKNEKFFNKPVSSTFHGRDIMAPIAAHLSKAIKIEEFGQKFNSKRCEKLDLTYKIDKINSKILATIQYIDSFGNLTTNIPVNTENQIAEIKSEIQGNRVLFNGPRLKENMPLTLEFEDRTHTGKFVSHFESVPLDSLLFLKGSSGFLEIPLNQGNASIRLGLNVGD